MVSVFFAGSSKAYEVPLAGLNSIVQVGGLHDFSNGFGPRSLALLGSPRPHADRQGSAQMQRAPRGPNLDPSAVEERKTEPKSYISLGLAQRNDFMRTPKWQASSTCIVVLEGPPPAGAIQLQEGFGLNGADDAGQSRAAGHRPEGCHARRRGEERGSGPVS